MVHHLDFSIHFFAGIPTGAGGTRWPSMNMVTHRFRPAAFTFLGLASGVTTLAFQVVDVVVHVISIPDDDRIPVA